MPCLHRLTPFILILSCSLHIAEAAIPESERNTLLSIAVYAHPLLSIPGGWEGILGSECNWYGVTCNENNDHIIKLSLMTEVDKDTRPQVIQDVSSLSSLESLDFDNPNLPVHLLIEESTETNYIPESERSALLEIIKYAHSRYQNEWSSAVGTECHWKGVVCSDGQTQAHVLSLDLSDFGLTKLSSKISQLPEIFYLDLNSNSLSTLPSEISYLRKLRFLHLESNQLIELPKEIKNLWALKKLILDNNQLTTLPSEIGQLKQVTELTIKNNQLTKIPTEIYNLWALESLTLDNNQLSQLPTEIGQLKQLTKLTLNNNQLTSLPIEIGRLSVLETLSLQVNQLKTLPTEIGQLTALKDLNLASNQLIDLPSEINQLIKLSTLNLNHNNFVTLPSEINQLTSLNRLILNHNYLDALPAGIGSLSRLESLDLHTNQLMELPSEIGLLSNLESLELHSNRLTILPSEIGRLTALTALDLHNNLLMQLPSEVSQLSQLHTLNLSSNQFAELPTDIGEIQNLKNLFLSDNHLATLPDNFTQLNKLKRLNLASNKLEAIPAEIFQLSTLNELILSSNQLTEIPQQIGQFRSLYFLDLSNNLLRILPSSIMGIQSGFGCFLACTASYSLSIENNCLSAITLPTEILDWMNSGKVWINAEASFFPDAPFINPKPLEKQKDICADPISLTTNTTLHHKNSDFIDFINTNKTSRQAKQGNPVNYTIYTPNEANNPSAILTTGVIPENSSDTWRVDSQGLENGRYEIIFWAENNTFSSGIQAWQRSFNKVSNELNLTNGDDLSSFFASYYDPNFPALSPSINLSYPLFSGDPALLEQIQQSTEFSSLQYDMGQLSFSASQNLFRMRAYKVEKSVGETTTGYQIADDGSITLATPNKRTITFAPAILNLESFNKAINHLNLSLLEVTPRGTFKIKANTLGEQNKYFSGRANLFSEPVIINQTETGVYFSAAQDAPNMKEVFHIFHNKEGQLMQQALPPTPYDWDAFKEELNALGFTHVSLALNGIISTQKDTIKYNAFMDYSVDLSPLPANVKTGFHSLGDINEDGYQDFRVVIKSPVEDNATDWQQILYLLPVE